MPALSPECYVPYPVLAPEPTFWGGRITHYIYISYKGKAGCSINVLGRILHQSGDQSSFKKHSMAYRNNTRAGNQGPESEIRQHFIFFI